MSMNDVKLSRKVGRPREFCIEQALETAMRLFWRKGYEGTSLTDLTAAIGISRPSLYAAFGSKEELFHRTLVRYTSLRDPLMRGALTQPTARGTAAALLFGSAEALTGPDCPGCLTVQAALTGSSESDSVRCELTLRREATVEVLRQRFEQALAEGDFPADIEPADMARYVVTVMNGMAVQAAGGAGAEALRRVAEIALNAWPEDKERHGNSGQGI